MTGFEMFALGVVIGVVLMALVGMLVVGGVQGECCGCCPCGHDDGEWAT